MITSVTGDLSIHPPTAPIPPAISVKMGDSATVFVCGRKVVLGPVPIAAVPFFPSGPMATTVLVEGRPPCIVGTVGAVIGPWTPAPIIGPGAPTVSMT